MSGLFRACTALLLLLGWLVVPNAFSQTEASMDAEMVQTSGPVGEWLENYDVALQQADAEGKPVFALFTGSDWCSWCMKFESEILKQQGFLSFAREHLVLLKLDYPSKPDRQPDWIVEQNRRLKERYGIRGYPTAVLLSAEGEVVATSGYLPRGAMPYVAHLRGLLRTPPQGTPLVDADSDSARKMSGSSHADAESRPLRIIRALIVLSLLLFVVLVALWAVARSRKNGGG